MPFIKDRKINGNCTNATNRRSRVWPVYFIYLHRLQMQLSADQVYHLVIPFSKGLIAVDSQVSGLPKKNHTSLHSPLSRLPRILRRVQLLPQRIQALGPVSLRPRERQRSNTFQTSALASRRKGWKIKLFPKSVERIAKFYVFPTS